MEILNWLTANQELVIYGIFFIPLVGQYLADDMKYYLWGEEDFLLSHGIVAIISFIALFTGYSIFILQDYSIMSIGYATLLFGVLSILLFGLNTYLSRFRIANLLIILLIGYNLIPRALEIIGLT